MMSPREGKGGLGWLFRSFCIFLSLTPDSTGNSGSMGAGRSEDIRESSTLFHMEAPKSVFPLNRYFPLVSVSADSCHLESAGSLHCSESKYGHSGPSVFVTTAQQGRLSVLQSISGLQCWLQASKTVVFA